MINASEYPTEWALLLFDLDETQEHLKSLIDQMNENGRIDEEDYAVQLGHIFAHLNRAWNARSLSGEIPEGEYAKYSRFPDDLDPVG